MTIFDDDPGMRWLFCMTHPDDEISICAWMAHLARKNPDRVWVSWTHSNAVREAEGRAVAALLGVPANNVFFHGATDGSVCEELASLLPKFQALASAIRPDRVVCGAFEQGHLDHDATNWLVNHAFEGIVVEVPFYYPYLTRLPRVNRFADPSGQEVRTLTPSERALKRQVARSYPSQAIWRNMVFAELRARLTGDGSLLSTERARVQRHRDFRTPNLPPGLAARVMASEKWKRWLAAMDAACTATSVLRGSGCDGCRGPGNRTN